MQIQDDDEPARGLDEPRFEELFERCAERALVYLQHSSLAGGAGVLDPLDVLQEAWLRARELRGRFRGGGERGFASWLCRIAENTARDLLRAERAGVRRRREPGPVSAVFARLSAEATGPATALGRSEELERLSVALEKLEEEAREVMLLRYFEERSLDEIAHRTGRSPSAVRRLLGRATSALGRELLDAGGPQ